MSKINTVTINKGENLVDRIIETINQLVEKFGFVINERYPKDIAVHDRDALKAFCFPGAKFAYCLGDTHSHIGLLGIYKGGNEMAGATSSLGSKDHFYLIEIKSSTQFLMKEISREESKELEGTPIKYKLNSVNYNLDHSVIDQRSGENIGNIHFEKVGDGYKNEFKLTIQHLTPDHQDHAVLKHQAQDAARKAAGTFFYKIVEVAYIDYEPEKKAVSF